MIGFLKYSKLILLAVLILLFSCEKRIVLPIPIPLSPKQIGAKYPPKKSSVPFYPVRGNHEQFQDLDYITDHLLPIYGNEINRLDDKSVNYFFDVNNIRIIIVDQQSEFSKEVDDGLLPDFSRYDGNINQLGLNWVESVIEGVGAEIDHVFIVYHSPAFPTYRNIGESFDRFADNRNAFWDMLMSHKSIVRAVFAAHTHYYSKIQVANPRTVPVDNIINDTNGIFELNGGTTGRNGAPNTIIEVETNGKNVYFRTVQANSEDDDFSLIEEWSIVNEQDKDIDKCTFAFICDHRNSHEPFIKNLKEIKAMSVNPAPYFSSIEFVIDGGDMDSIQENYEGIYLKIFN